MNLRIPHYIITCLVAGCPQLPNDPPCTQEEAKVLSAITFGDTAILDAYLKISTAYDFECRRHGDFLRSGEGLFWSTRETKHISIFRTYLKSHPCANKGSASPKAIERNKQWPVPASPAPA